jgi:hypothetical protein
MFEFGRSSAPSNERPAEYLHAWALFMDWCAQRGQTIA